ncbi:MAG: cation transporter [Blautia sp.]|nr:cation transporter [Blautia sp.]
MNREKTIIRTSIIGIIANVFLAGFKALVGLASHSVAVVMDAVNNLSDALSSLITIIGTKLAGKAPDKKHPLGYGRIEYLSASIISVIVLYAGVTSFVESVKKILHPETPDYSAVTLLIIAVAVGVKILLGRYVKGVGEKVNSDSLVASGSDAMFDSIISASTLVAAIIYLKAGVSLEAWLGAVISAVIIKSGVEMLRDTISEILGERVDRELSLSVKKCISEFPQVQGTYDLLVHSYGPDRLVGSAHIEIPDTMTADQIDALTRQISARVIQETGVIMTGVSVYSVNTKNDKAAKMLEEIRRIVMSHEGILQMHGFYLDEAEKTVTFDMIMDFAVKDKEALYQTVLQEIRAQYPAYEICIAQDVDISD